MQNSGNTMIAPLGDLSDFKVAKGDPDVRGWEVQGGDGRIVGEVHDLMVDREAGRVRYLDVEVDKDVAGSKGRHVLIPIGAAQLDQSNDRVSVSAMQAEEVASIPSFEQDGLTREYELRVLQAFGRGQGNEPSGSGPEFYRHVHFDDSRFYRGSQGGEASPATDDLEDETVEADLRRERMDVDEDGIDLDRGPDSGGTKR